MSRIHLFTAILLASALSLPAYSQTLTLDDYLLQVEGKNENFVSSKELSQGAQLTVVEGDLMYSPTLYAEASWKDDRFRNALFPSAYSSFINNYYTVGVRQKTSFGLTAGLSYVVNKLGYLNGVDFTTGLPSNRQFWEATPKIDLSFSLWRNLFGGETQATKALTESSAVATQYNYSYTLKSNIAAAENAYVKLVQAQELIRVFTGSVERAETLMSWINRQVGLRLSDNTDLYQAQANLENQRLSLQGAKDDFRVAAREFNKLRNMDSDEVTEKLVLPSVTGLTKPSRGGLRDDTLAMQANVRTLAAQAKLGYERNRPTFEAFGSFALNARETEFGPALSNSLGLGNQTTYYGLRFSMPLGLGMSSDARRGFELERNAAEKLVAQKEFEDTVLWKDLEKQFDEAKKRLEIAERLAKIQKQKFDAETLRLKRGRTTTYQTVLFNQEYNQAEAARILAQSRILNIHAQMKTFGGSEK